MKHFLQPDDYRQDFGAYTAEDLRSRGIRFLMCDIDNTLVTYDDPEPTPRLLAWFKELQEAGITVGFMSNNDEARVSRFNRDLGFTAFPDAHKPLTKTMKRFLKESGLRREEVAHLGDQIFTDVCMARACGVTSLLVPPIKDVLTPFFRFKRMLEKPLVAYYVAHRRSN